MSQVDNESIIQKGFALPKDVKTIIHIGVGKSRLPLKYINEGYTVNVMDLAYDSFDPEVKKAAGRSFVLDLTSFNFEIGIHDYAICVDVLEHIEYNELNAALHNLSRLTPRGVVAISNTDSRSAEWWKDKLSEFFNFSSTYNSATHFIGRY